MPEAEARFFSSFGLPSEIRATEKARHWLQEVAWAAPLLNGLGSDITAAKPSTRFEARLAATIHEAGRNAEYEHRTGVGEKSVDFRVEGSPEWLIEVVSIEPREIGRSGEIGDSSRTLEL